MRARVESSAAASIALSVEMSDRHDDKDSYIAAHIAPTLTPALCDLARERPADPITFLANRLLALRPPPPVQRVPPQRQCAALLEALRLDRSAPELPVQTHAARLSSGKRGLSLDCLRALRSFYCEHGGLDKVMGDVCKEAGFDASMVALTRSTGLSLAESIVLRATGGDDVGALVSRATSFFSYSWTGTRLSDMLDAIERTVAALEAADGRKRYVWIDMFCASQNLLAGVFRDPAVSKVCDPAGYAARKEDTDRIFDDALDVIQELLLYCSPLTAEWQAPPHPYLLPDRGEPPAEWMRHGPGAMTRAWCMFEIVSALARGCKLHVVLNTADAEGFERILTEQFDDIAHIVASLEARDAQISKIEDREVRGAHRTAVSLLPNGALTVASLVSREPACSTFSAVWQSWTAASVQSLRASVRRFASGWPLKGRQLSNGWQRRSEGRLLSSRLLACC